MVHNVYYIFYINHFIYKFSVSFQSCLDTARKEKIDFYIRGFRVLLWLKFYNTNLSISALG